MANQGASARKRARLSKAEIKAYEARRAAEKQRLVLQDAVVVDDEEVIVHSYILTRDDEYGVIRHDLIRLGKIVALLGVLLAVATVILS